MLRNASSRDTMAARRLPHGGQRGRPDTILPMSSTPKQTTGDALAGHTPMMQQ